MDVGAGLRADAGRGGLAGATGGLWGVGDPGPPDICFLWRGTCLEEWSAHCRLTGTSADLFQGGDLPSVTDTRRPRLYLLQWLKSDKALMMLFNDGTFQVSSLGKGRGRS